MAVNVTLTSRCWKPFWAYQYGHLNNVTTPAPYYTGLTLQRHCMGNTVAVQTKVNFSVTSKLSYHHRRTTSLYRHPPEGDDLENWWIGSHSVTLLSDCTVTVQPILEWKKPKSFVYAVCAFVSFSKAKRVVTNVYSLAERKKHCSWILFGTSEQGDLSRNIWQKDWATQLCYLLPF